MTEKTRRDIFGSSIADNIVTIDWNEHDGWGEINHIHNGIVSFHANSQVLHYGQGVFEGLKAYKIDGSRIGVFRPFEHGKRLNDSCRRMAIPTFPVRLFMYALEAFIKLNTSFIPDPQNGGFYIRPLIVATEDSLGFFGRSNKFKFIMMGCSLDSYFVKGKGLNVKVEPNLTRAFPGGTGSVKSIGNYAGTILSQEECVQEGYDQVLWLDGIEKKYVEELSSSNIFFVYKDHIKTPKLNGSILPGITRHSVIEICRDRNILIKEGSLSIDDLYRDFYEGKLLECFVTGTTANITPVKKLSYKNNDIEFKHFYVSKEMSNELKDIYKYSSKLYNDWLEVFYLD